MSSIGVRPATSGGHPRVRRRVTTWAALGVLALLATLLTPLSTAGAQSLTVPDGTDLTAKPGDKSVTLSFSANDNGSPIIRWEFRAHDAAFADDCDNDKNDCWFTVPGGPTASSLTVTSLATGESLKNGTSYNFEVRAFNSRGAGGADTASATPSTVPAAPTNLVLFTSETVTRNSQLRLQWTAFTNEDTDTVPRTDGGEAVTHFEYQQKTGDQDYAPWTIIPGSGPGTAGYTVKGLTNGTTYQFKIRAVNKNGSGAAAESKPLVPATVPGAPRGLKAAIGDKAVTLSWSSGLDGGSPITSWEFSRDGGTSYAPIPGSNADTSSYTVGGLSNGTTYNFNVRAKNVVGSGAAATVSTTPGNVPGKPTNLRAPSVTGDTITLTWSAPANNGDSAITGYKLSQKTGTGSYGEFKAVTSYTTAQDGLSCTTSKDPTAASQCAEIEGLTAGTAYQFKVLAISAVGEGAASDASSPAFPGTVPAAPGSFTATASYVADKDADTVTLSWTAGDNGGTPVTEWQYEYVRVGTSGAETEALAQALLSTTIGNADNAWETICDSSTDSTCTGTTSYTVPKAGVTTGLIPAAGQTYYVVIRAVNARGDGLPSSMARVSTQRRAPSAPVVFVEDTADASITLSWLAPKDGGLPITGHELAQKTGSGSWVTITPSVTPRDASGNAINDTTTPIASYSAVVSSLQKGTSYTFRVRAKNSIGSSSWGVTPEATAGGPPTPGADNIGSGTPTTPSLTAIVTRSNTVQLTMARTTGSGANNTAEWQYTYKAGDGDYLEWAKIPESNNGTSLSIGDQSSNSFTIPSLANGLAHTFKIRAVNTTTVGVNPQAKLAGPPLEMAKPIIPGIAPPAPVGLAAAEGDKQITLTWTSGGDGGSPITEWQYCGGSTGLNLNATGDNADADYDDAGEVRVYTRATLCAADGTGWTPIANSGPDTTSVTIKTTIDNANAPSDDDDGDGTTNDSDEKPDPLVNGASYVYLVRAANAVGDGAMAQASAATPGVAPAAPLRVQATARDASVDITTYPAATIHGVKNVRFEVRKKEAGGSYDAYETLSATGKDTVGGLTNGVTYTFEVRAVNKYGNGTGTESDPVTPVGAPPAGSELNAEAGDGQVELSWSSRGSGGSNITKWQYRMDSGSGYGAWTDITGSDADTTSHTVTDLDNGISYTFQVRAVNKLGDGDALESSAATPSTVPPQPTSVTAERGDGEVTLTWTAGTSGDAGEADYSAPTTGWHVRMKADDGDYGDWMAIADSDADTTSYTATDLTNGSAYVFQVRAMNVMGNSEPTTSNAATPATTPSAPTVSVADGDGSAVVSWTAGDDGGSAVTSWHIQVSGGQWINMTTAYGLPLGVTAVPIPGLDDGTAYTFGIRGENAVGAGAAGTADLAANSAPGAPTVTASGSNGSITVSWTAGDDGGSSITSWHYRTKVSISDYGDWTATDGTSVTLDDLNTGISVLSYTFQVRAVNGVGEGDAGTSNEATPVEAPPVNGVFYSGVIDGPDFCANFSLGGARLFAHDGDGDGVADVCSLPYTRREAVARQNAVNALAYQNGAEFWALVNAACDAAGGDEDCGGDTPGTPPTVRANDGGPYYSGVVTGPAFCANLSLGGLTLYPHDGDGDGVAEVCALPYTRSEGLARQLAGDILAAKYAADFRRELSDSCRDLTGADFGDDPAAEDVCS